MTSGAMHPAADQIDQSRFYQPAYEYKKPGDRNDDVVAKTGHRLLHGQDLGGHESSDEQNAYHIHRKFFRGKEYYRNDQEA